MAPPDQTGNWKGWFLRRTENRSNRRKTSRSKDENQQQTQPTCDAESGNRTRATLVGGECSHHCAIPAPLTTLLNASSLLLVSRICHIWSLWVQFQTFPVSTLWEAVFHWRRTRHCSPPKKTNFGSTLKWSFFSLEDALSVWTNLGKHSLFVWLFVSSTKTGTRRIMRMDALSSIVRLERSTTEDSWSRRIMRPLV